MLELTRGEIITEALSQAGRPDLISNGRLWLNLFLEDQYTNQDWPWLIKTALGQAVVQGGAIPTDYRSAVSATVGRTVTNQQRLDLIKAAQFNELEGRGTQIGGTPEFVWIDRLTRTANFYPLPSASVQEPLVWNLRYYHIPDIPASNDTTADNKEPLWEPNKHILIQAVYVKALEYNDDVRFDKELERLTGMLQNHKMNSHDLRAGKNRLTFGKGFRPRRGRF